MSGALYFPTYEYNYKVIIGHDIILQEYYTIDRRKYENKKRYTSINSTKSAYELQKENLRGEQGVWKNGVSDRSTADPRYHRCVTLITRKSTAVQTLRSEHAGQGESELPKE